MIINPHFRGSNNVLSQCGDSTPLAFSSGVKTEDYVRIIAIRQLHLATLFALRFSLDVVNFRPIKRARASLILVF